MTLVTEPLSLKERDPFSDLIAKTPLPILKSGSFKRSWYVPQQLMDALRWRERTIMNPDRELTDPDMNGLSTPHYMRGVPKQRAFDMFYKYMPLFVHQTPDEYTLSMPLKDPEYSNIFASPFVATSAPGHMGRTWDMDRYREWAHDNVGRIYDELTAHNPEVAPFLNALGAVGNPLYPALKAPYLANGDYVDGSNPGTYDPRNRLDMSGTPHNTREQEQLAVYRLADDVLRAKREGNSDARRVIGAMERFLPYVTYGGAPYGWDNYASHRGDSISYTGAEPILMPYLNDGSMQMPVEEMLHATHSRMNNMLGHMGDFGKLYRPNGRHPFRSDAPFRARVLDAMEDDAVDRDLTAFADDLIEQVLSGRKTYDDVGQAIELAANANAIYNRRLDPQGNFNRRRKGSDKHRWYYTAEGTPLSGSNRIERWARHVPSLAYKDQLGVVSPAASDDNLAMEGAASAVNWLLTNPKSMSYITHMFPHTYKTVVGSMQEASDILDDKQPPRAGTPWAHASKTGKQYMDKETNQDRVRPDLSYADDTSPGWEADAPSRGPAGIGLQTSMGEPKVKRVDGDVPNILSVYGAN